MILLQNDDNTYFTPRARLPGICNWKQQVCILYIHAMAASCSWAALSFHAKAQVSL